MGFWRGECIYSPSPKAIYIQVKLQALLDRVGVFTDVLNLFPNKLSRSRMLTLLRATVSSWLPHPPLSWQRSVALGTCLTSQTEVIYTYTYGNEILMIRNRRLAVVFLGT